MFRKPPTCRSRPVYLLRRTDQAMVAGLVLLALGAMISWWISQGGLQGRMMEVDRAEPETAAFQVDVNSAEWPELVQLPGVGETIAHRIVESRDADGPFADHKDLQERVRGIGPRTLERIRPYLLPVPAGSEFVGDSDAATPSGC